MEGKWASLTRPLYFVSEFDMNKRHALFEGCAVGTVQSSREHRYANSDAKLKKGVNLAFVPACHPWHLLEKSPPACQRMPGYKITSIASKSS